MEWLDAPIDHYIPRNKKEWTITLILLGLVTVTTLLGINAISENSEELKKTDIDLFEEENLLPEINE